MFHNIRDISAPGLHLSVDEFRLPSRDSCAGEEMEEKGDFGETSSANSAKCLLTRLGLFNRPILFQLHQHNNHSMKCQPNKIVFITES